MQRPNGTVTFLFTDIEASTRLLAEIGAERYGRALANHRRLLRAALDRHGGYEVDTQGDAFLASFHGAPDAVSAAAEAQRSLAANPWPEGCRVLVRMGIHTCEAMATEEGYVGIGVHRGARICAAGHGGQTLVSQATRDVLDAEADGFALVDLGQHRLKDLTEPQRLYQVLVPGLESEFPPLRTIGYRPTNLPVQANALVGREREVAEIAELLRRDDVRLVTLTGSGGTGKTRLALQTVAELADDFPDGTFLVALASITDPELVVPTIAGALGVSEAAGQSLTSFLATKSLLLVADNLEQVAPAAPQLAELLAQAPDLKLLATSREALHLAVERLYPVVPLELPDSLEASDPARLLRCESVALFVERAQAVEPAFELTAETGRAVAEICARLDGLPLALELAAARVAVLSPEAMLLRLGEPLELLTSGPLDLPERQRTLRDTLAWSHDLLEPNEQRLFAGLGAFAGGFTLEAAEAVCEADLDDVASLARKSLIRRAGERFEMLETIREYALERLAAGGDGDALRARHAAWFERAAEEAYAERFEREAERSDQLEREHDNLRAALDWLGTADPQRRLRMTGALGWFWHVHSHLTEGRARLAEALAVTSGRDEARARALAGAGELAAWQGDVLAAKPLIEEAISIWRELGDQREAGMALHQLGWGHFFAGDDPAARRCMEESLDSLRSAGESLANRAQLGLLQVLVSMGEVESVEPLAREALAAAQRLGDLWAEHLAHHFLADCALITGDCPTAEERYRESLRDARRMGDEAETCYELQGVAMAAAGNGNARRSLCIAGAAETHLEAMGIAAFPPFWTALLDRYLGRARQELGAEAADSAWQDGRGLGLDPAVEEALGTG